MPDTLNAAELRRLAIQCESKANAEGCAADERDRLLKMRESLLALAENADWLAGKISARQSLQPAY
jgi:hypothetical protein